MACYDEEDTRFAETSNERTKKSARIKRCANPHAFESAFSRIIVANRMVCQLPKLWLSYTTLFTPDLCPPKERLMVLASKSRDRDVTTTKNDSNQASTAKKSFLSRHQTMVNFWLDSVLLVNFLTLIFVAVIVQFIFPPAEASVGYTLWNMTLSQWMDVQFGVLAVFCLGIVLHLMMHWTWVCGIVGSRLLRGRDGKKRVMDDGQRTILGVGLMIVLLNIMGLGIACAALAIRAPS